MKVHILFWCLIYRWNDNVNVKMELDIYDKSVIKFHVYSIMFYIEF